MGGIYPGDRFGNALFENPGNANHWITIQLVGTESNRSAIGTRIRFDVTNRDGTTRSIYKHVNSGGSFGANPLRQTIGLGRAKSIDTLQVDWPATGARQLFANVPLDTTIRVTEQSPDIEILPIGGAAPSE